MAKPEMTRRQLAAALAAIPAVAAAQTAQAPVKDDLTIQRENVKRNIDLLDGFKVPIATEPSIVFKP